MVRQSQAPTITKIRVLSRRQQVVRLDIEESFTQKNADQLSEAFASLVDQFELVLFSDYNKGSLANIGDMITCLGIRLDLIGENVLSYSNSNSVTEEERELMRA